MEEGDKGGGRVGGRTPGFMVRAREVTSHWYPGGRSMEGREEQGEPQKLRSSKKLGQALGLEGRLRGEGLCE